MSLFEAISSVIVQCAKDDAARWHEHENQPTSFMHDLIAECETGDEERS